MRALDLLAILNAVDCIPAEDVKRHTVKAAMAWLVEHHLAECIADSYRITLAGVEVMNPESVCG